MIRYFDFENNLTEQSPKNMARAFRENELYLIKSDGERIDNESFDQLKAKEIKNDQTKKAREKKYFEQTDQMLLEIQAMEILGQDTTAKKAYFIKAYNKIKSDLPLVN